jgi:hypothetical protein
MANEPTNRPDITGVWILRTSFYENLDTGTRVPSSPAKGVLMLHASGRMMALITPANQEPVETESEQAAAYKLTNAYSGRYRLEGVDRFVTTVDFCLWHSWLGSEQARTYKLTEKTLDIISAPCRFPLTGDAWMRGFLSWVREDVTNAQS